MTQQVRTSYRKHRKVTWAIVIALAGLAAAMVIPIASGDAGKTYTLTVSPSAACAGTGASTVVTLTNTAKSASLGSAEIYFPAGKIASVSSPATLRNDASTDTIALQNLNLGKNASVQITVTFKSTAFFATTNITAVVKQSNNFNDTSGTANLFDNPAPWPQMTLSTCATVSGLVWRDKNEDTSVAADTSAEPRQGGWTITAYKSGSATALASTTSSSVAASLGTFSLKLPTGSAYWLCETKPANSGTWAQSTPTGPPTAPTACDSDTPNAIGIPTLSADLPGQNFGNLATTTVNCDSTSQSNDGTSQVQPSVRCKASGEYVFDAWTQGTSQYVALHPVTSTNACVSPYTDTTHCQWFVQKITWTGLTNAQDPLQYDDHPGINGPTYESMLFCQKDPRSSEFGIAAGTAALDVLPTAVRNDGDASTSCLITSTNSVSATGVRQRIDYVFTVSDGYGKVG